MSLKTLTKQTGRGFATLSKQVANGTAATLNPKKGSRKTRLTLLLAIPFLVFCGILAFIYRQSMIDILKIMQKVITMILSIFVAGNSVEHISEKFGRGGDID